MTTIDECTICGRTASNHSNPNTDYRGINGDAPPTDHYYFALDDGVESKASELFGQNDPSEILGGTFGTPEDTANDLYNMTSHDYSIQEYDKWDNKIIDMIGQGEPQFDPSSLDSWLRSNGVYNNDLIYDLVREWGKGTRKVGESKASENEFDDMSYLELRDHILTMQNKNPSSPWYEDGYLMTRAKNLLSSKRYLENEAKASETQDDFDWLNEDDDRFTATMWEQSDGTWIVNSEGSQYDSSFTARFTDSVDAHKYMDKVNRGELTKDDLYNDEMSGYRILESKATEEESLTMEKAWKEWKTGYETSKDSWLLFAKNYYPPLTQSEIEWGWKYGDGVESLASEYSIKEEFDLQDQDGKYEMLSKADLSVTDATNYSTYSHSELPEEVKDSLKGDEDSYGESWSRKSSIDRIEALERLGIKQGDAIKLSGVEFEDFGEDLQGALKGDVEDARMHMKADKDMLDKADPLEPSYSFQWQQGGEVDNPNSEFGQNYPDYNKIGESQTSMTKYECEHCNLGFKSNESLSRHHRSIHKIASEDIDGYSVDAGFTGQNSFTDMSSISKEDVTQEWWNNVATPSSKARILNKTGTPVENTFGLPSYYELTQETKAYLLGLDDFSFESKASEFMTELEQMKHGAWNDDFDFNQSKLYVSTPAQKRQYQMQGIPTESNGEPKYSELYDDDIYAVQEIQESPIPDQVDVYDHDTFLPVKYDEIVPDDFSYRPSTWGESKANESDTFLPRSDPLFSDEEIVGGIRKHYDTVDYYQDDRPDFNNDPDFEGNVNGISVEPSQYTQSGMDHTDYGRGDIDESKSSEFNGKCKRCGLVKDLYKVNVPESMLIGLDEYPDKNVPSPICEDCYYDVFGEPQGDPDYGYESKANENKTYTCDKCGKVGDSFTDMAQEECPEDINANHQIPIFGDQVKPRGIGEASEVCPECNSSKVHINRDKGDSRFGQGKYACNNCGNTFGGEAKASEGSEDVYNYEYVDDKVVCKNCGMKFDNAIDDARAMKDHSEIHESLYDKEAYAHEDDLDTLMWDNENPDDKGKQWKDKKGKKQESIVSEGDRKRIKDWHGNTGTQKEDGSVVDDKDLIKLLDESKASEDITFADQHRGIQKDMIEFIRRKGGSASELDIDREFDLLNNFNNEYKHLQALKNDGTLTSAGWQPDNSGNDGYPDGSYIYNLNESYSSEAGLDDHSCPECGFITSDNSDYVDHLNAHED